MDEFVNQLMSKVGLDKATAEKVVAFLKDNVDEIPKWLGSNDMAKGIMNNLPGGMGQMFGGKKD